MISTKTTKTEPSASSASHASSAETIANNNDLLNQILLRLPTKSLLKFKCVSKQWKSLICSPRFARCRKSHVNSPCALMVETFSTEANRYEFVSLDSSHSEASLNYLTFVNVPGGVSRILQSVNGLLLCAIPDSEKGTIYYVHNPTTKQRTQLPPVVLPRIHFCLNLAFDPLRSPYYKVVCVRQCTDSSNEDVYVADEVVYEIDVYSSKERHWISSARGPFTVSGYIDFGGGVFCNNAIHWLSQRGNSLYFDVDDGQLHEMPAPSIPENMEERRAVYFGASRGHLHLVEIYEPPSIKFKVYEMSEDYSGWHVKFQVDLSAVVTAFPGMTNSYVEPDNLLHYAFEILCVCRGETDDDSFLVLHINTKMIRFSLKDGTSFEKLCDVAPDDEGQPLVFPCHRLWVDAYQYCESLARV